MADFSTKSCSMHLRISDDEIVQRRKMVLAALPPVWRKSTGDRLKNGVDAVQPIAPPVNGRISAKPRSEKKAVEWRPVPGSQTEFSVRSVPLKDDEDRSHKTPPPRTGRTAKSFDSRPLEGRSFRDGPLRRYLDPAKGVGPGGLRSIRVDHRESRTSYAFVVGGGGPSDDVVVTRRMDEFRREYGAYGDSEESVRLSKTGSSSRSVGSSQSGGSKKGSGGFFSFLRWFKREKSEEGEEEERAEEEEDAEDISAPNSPALGRAHSASICGSVDTLFSTATAASFAYVHPNYYRPFGNAGQAETRIAAGPETNTYRNRIRERDRARLIENNISLREKYNLYASGTLRRSVDHIHEIVFDERLDDLLKPIEHIPGSKSSTLSRKKRQAPPPPFKDNLPSSDLSLPATFATVSPDLKQHRRTVSESAKYKVNCHVKGKRKAPPPPDQKSEKCLKLDRKSVERNNSSLKKKRPAPPPPTVAHHKPTSSIVEIVNEAALEILNDVEKNDSISKQDSKEETVSNASTVDVDISEVSTDTLRLEKGVLKPNNKMEHAVSDPKVAPTSPVSPRPWYKRGAVSKEQPSGSGGKKKDKDRKIDDWMLESGFPRRTSLLNTDGSKFNIFSKIDRPEEKRKSQISILTNISELDREAAEIVQKGKAREQALLASHDAKYYSNNEDATTNGVVIEEVTALNEDVEIPKKSSTRELISLFNAITNVTKVTVNSSFFAKEGSSIFKRESNAAVYEEDKADRVTFRETKVRETSEMAIGGRDIFTGTPGATRQIVSTFEVKNSVTSSGCAPDRDKKIARVTIEELDEYDAESPAGANKAQAMYEANRLTRHQSPTIPTIVEVSESSVRTSPASTVESITNEVTPEPTAPPAKDSSWICPRCTLENQKWKITCEACHMWRPSPLDVSPENTGGTPSALKVPYYKPVLDTIALPGISKPAYKKTDKDSIAVAKPSDIKPVIKSAEPSKTDTEGNKIDEENAKPEDVRKARLAYFNKSNAPEEAALVKDTQTTSEIKPAQKNAEEERMMLREMLKEMKHSLPKRPKNKISSDDKTKTASAQLNAQADKKEDPEVKTGAIRKVPRAESSREKRYTVSSKGDLAEAYLVDSETRVEEIKVKKPCEKVSSASQTSAMVRQIVPTVKSPTGTTKEVIVPITVEEYTFDKDGKLQMSISKQARKIGTGTFELMRPRDFATIEAIKTGGISPPVHLYANIPQQGNAQSTSSVFTKPSTSKTVDEISPTHNTNDKEFHRQLSGPNPPDGLIETLFISWSDWQPFTSL
ncbi:hypothetical protein AAG570_000993 [Ranatra chinensis]|uniref:RanBP2-type domain-containing protein n=1 Tax=Ranatra chinensis TaxID=642074 RepID=A0ABD0YYR2_9HEMI